MGKLNAEWHNAHPMPKKPSLDERVAWHLEHARACACRPIPGKVQAEIDRRKGGEQQR